MDFFTLLKAVLLGIVEGLTEFAPVSSTVHIIIVDDIWLQSKQFLGQPAANTFMVLVDARHDYSDQVSTTEQKAMEDRQQVATERLMGALGRFGAMRFAGARLITAFLAGYRQLAPKNLAAVTVLQSKSTRIAASPSEMAASKQDDVTLRGATLGDLPLRVLVAEESMSGEPTWVEGQRRHARLSSTSRLITVNNSGHYIQLDQPEQVVTAVLDVLSRTPN